MVVWIGINAIFDHDKRQTNAKKTRLFILVSSKIYVNLSFKNKKYMKQLEFNFTGKGEVSGVLFWQMKREKDICLYKRNDGYYEVIRVRKQKAGTRKFAGQEIFFEEKEYYPKGEDWGKHEWCTKDYEKALEYFDIELEKLNEMLTNV